MNITQDDIDIDDTSFDYETEDGSVKCNIYGEWIKNSKKIIIKGYEGIPQNLILNLIGWTILILIFSILRKKAWNYGRIALVQRNEEINWTSLYGPKNTRRSSSQSNDTNRGLIQTSNNSRDRVEDTGYFNWILITMKLKDEHFKKRCGPDAVQYLSFQRHLIFLASVITFICMTIILPIHIHGGNESKKINFEDFKTGTISNMEKDSKFLWVHVILSIVFIFLSIAVMRHFSRSLKFIEIDPSNSRTVMITGIPKRNCNEDLIKCHFYEIYSDIEIKDLSFAYDISRLQDLEFSRLVSLSAGKKSEEYLQRKGKRPVMQPHVFGNLCCCCKICGLKTTDAIDFYKKEQLKYEKECDIEKRRALKRPLGISFVSFETNDMAEKIVRDYRTTAKCFNQTPESKFSQKLRSQQWIVNFAPLPEDIYWENLSLGYKIWYFKAAIVNLTLIILIIFYSTPVFLLNALNTYLAINMKYVKEDNTTIREPTTINAIVSDTMPTVLLWIAAVTLPSLITISDKILGFWTKTAENRSRMVKNFTFLLFMVIILPSLGLTSIASILREGVLKWNCIFWTGNGAFFVNYVTTSSFLGTASELMRLPELFIYAIKLCFGKSSQEIAGIRKSVLWDFQLGAQYSWMMLIFAIFTIFSLICPLICPIGLIYLILKHFVDRYNIFFAYGPTKVDKEVHGTAINFVIVCMFLLQVIIVAYLNYSNEKNSIKAIQVFSIVGFCITTAIFIGQVLFNMCANFSPILYSRNDNQISQPIEASIKSENEAEEDQGDARVDVEDVEVSHDISHTTSMNSNNSYRTFSSSYGPYIPYILRSDNEASSILSPSSSLSYIDDVRTPRDNNQNPDIIIES